MNTADLIDEVTEFISTAVCEDRYPTTSTFDLREIALDILDLDESDEDGILLPELDGLSMVATGWLWCTDPGDRESPPDFESRTHAELWRNATLLGTAEGDGDEGVCLMSQQAFESFVVRSQ